MQTPDPRNAHIKIYVNGELLPRSQAKISVFDSSVQGGDAVWEGLRVYRGRIAALEPHLRRLQDSAHALAFAGIPSTSEIREAIFATLRANNMDDGVHIRLTLTRGEKLTSGMNPKLNVYGCGLIILAEWKPPVYGDEGIRLVTSAIRRNSPQHLDSKIHHNNLLNNILAAIEANVAGVDCALMLDAAGYISETNDTNVFIIRDGVLYTPFADSCLPGITRRMILDLARSDNIKAVEKNLSLTELYVADEAFTTGTMGELTPILQADGRTIGDGGAGPMTRRLQELHRQIAWETGEPLPATPD